MEPSGHDGLGLSLAIYMAAIVATMGVLAVPVYMAIGPQVYENPRPEPLDPLLNGPIVGQRVSTAIPLAFQKQQNLVDPKVLAELNAKTRPAPPPRHQVAHVPAQRRPAAAMAEAREPRERSGFSLFNLFGG